MSSLAHFWGRNADLKTVAAFCPLGVVENGFVNLWLESCTLWIEPIINVVLWKLLGIDAELFGSLAIERSVICGQKYVPDITCSRIVSVHVTIEFGVDHFLVLILDRSYTVKNEQRIKWL